MNDMFNDSIKELKSIASVRDEPNFDISRLTFLLTHPVVKFVSLDDD